MNRKQLLEMMEKARNQYLRNAERMGFKLDAALVPVIIPYEDPDNGDYDDDEPKEVVSSGDELVIRIAGPIDPYWDGVDVYEIIEILDRYDAQRVRLLINSPGGYMYDGLALYSELRRRVNESNITLVTEVVGIAASAAALIYLAGDERIINPASMIMIHPPSGGGFLYGRADDIETDAAMLVRDLRSGERQLDEIYADRLSGVDNAELNTWIDEERLFTAREAAEAGFGEYREDTSDSSGTDDTTATSEEPTNVQISPETRARADAVMNDIRAKLNS